MANIKKKSKVKGVVPAEVVKAVSSGKDAGLALYNSLSINVKTNETEAEREQRKFRRRYICRAFNLKADDLEHFLEEYKEVEKNTPTLSEADMLKNHEAAAKEEKRASKALNKESKKMIASTIEKIVSLAGFAIAPGITIVASILGLAINLKKNKKAQEGQAAKETKEQVDYANKLEDYMSKVECLNKYMEADMAEIMEKKKTLSREKFSAFMKEKMASYREKMRAEGYQISDEPQKDGASQEQEEQQESNEKAKPKKKTTTRKGKSTKKKAEAPQAEAEGGEKEA